MSFNTTDISNGVSISGSTNPFNTYIKTQNAGVYNIQFSAQVEKTDSGTDVIVIWLRKNGIDLTDSATKLTLSGNSTKVVAAWNWFVSSAANDYYQIIWVSADTGMRLYAEPINDTPGIPSVILTVNRVDQFLSNTGSFSGSFTGEFTGSLFGTAATASYYQETDPIFVAKSASLATTGSNNFNGNQTITGSLSQGLEGNIATGEHSHAEGSITKAIGNYSHAEGDNTQAKGSYSHAEGQETMTLASAQYSHAEGNNTIAAANHQHVQGQWNITSSISAAFIVGNGTDDGNRSNLIYAHDSTVEITGSLNVSGGITGSLFGTASWAESASQALTASFVRTAQTASYVLQAVSASFASTASFYNGQSIVGANLITQTDPSAIRYLRINADNSISQLTSAQLQTDLGVPVTVVKTSNNSTPGSSTAWIDITDLSFNATAGALYEVRMVCILDSPTTSNGVKLGISSSVAPSLVSWVFRVAGTTANTSYQTTVAPSITYDGATAGAAVAFNTNNIGILEGFIQLSSNGTVNGRFGNEVATSAATIHTCKSGSFIQYRQIS